MNCYSQLFPEVLLFCPWAVILVKLFCSFICSLLLFRICVFWCLTGAWIGNVDHQSLFGFCIKNSLPDNDLLLSPNFTFYTPRTRVVQAVTLRSNRILELRNRSLHVMCLRVYVDRVWRPWEDKYFVRDLK